MEIDIKIYIENLKKFFTTNSGASKLLTEPGIGLEEFLEEVEIFALSNYEKDGDPTLNKRQIIDVLRITEMKKLKLGLTSLVEEGKVDVEKYDEEGKPIFKLTEEGLKELKESKIFQETKFGRIYLN
tara:strand:+ start:24 stop:404 length:381 start_codon:yes stop_codon:yes gene_type:complete